MKLKRTLSIALALCLLLSPVALAAETEAADYTTAGKLLKQLWAGSGFSGTLTLDITPKEGRQGEGLSTQKPIEAALDYIYVRATDTSTDEHRADISLADPQTAAHISFKDGRLSVQSDIIGDGWYTLPAGMGVRQSGAQADDGKLGELQSHMGAAMDHTGMPALAAYLLPAILRAQAQTQELQGISADYITRIDLWIEGYRQSAVLGKLEDGTTTITTNYVIPPAAIKAQAKQMLLNLLGDSATLTKLSQIVGAEDAALMLDPRLQSYYFKAIDELPLESDMTIERGVSLKGDTLGLHISLPLYDAKGGAATLTYDRSRGEGDLPEDNVVSFKSGTREISLKFQTYKSMADITVWQGTLLNRPTGAGSFSVGERDEAADAEQRALSAAFSLTLATTVGRDEEDRDTLTYSASLTLQPDASAAQGDDIFEFEPLDIKLDAYFASKTLKTASTEMDATLTIDGENLPSVVKLSLAGKTRKKWTPEPVPDTAVSVSDMSGEDRSALLPGIITRGGMLLVSCFNMPVETPPPAEGGGQPTDGADATATPEVFETLAPGETPDGR